MAGRFGSDDLVAVGDFLAVLRLDNDQSRATDQRFVHIEQVARPALVALGLSPADAGKAYDAVLSLVRAASQALAGVPGVWMRSNSGNLDSAALVAESVRNRLLRREDVASALRSEGVAATAQLPNPSSTGTTLTKKLDRGEIVPTARAAAARARMEWSSFEMARTPPVPDRPSFSRLRSLLTASALDAQLNAAAQAADAPYGNAMLTDMRRRVGRLAKDGDLPAGLDADLLMGLVYDLTARCEIWWSPEFDVTADVHE
ncbi:hypothetical protein [Phycicoccus sp. Root101]|uniref:hypothetical protein n=1 Tax=Phycicoccus sp. Root101 TaxID=1736421 RepID=UPI00070396E9|nr:hypothetical protein [Phycicoccus sp. Root101]KQU64122.1 hypothetical protein ASC58_19605 [Phycicoccus sp. Root101]